MILETKIARSLRMKLVKKTIKHYLKSIIFEEVVDVEKTIDDLKNVLKESLNFDVVCISCDYTNNNLRMFFNFINENSVVENLEILYTISIKKD